MKRNFVYPSERADALPTVGDFLVDHQGGKTILWDTEADPAHIIDGEQSPEFVAGYLAGFDAGRKDGMIDGRRQGIVSVQAGLRALLGAASASDLNTFIQAAGDAGA